MAKSWSIKSVRLSFVLGEGTFSSGGNTKTIEGLPCDISITKPGGDEANSAEGTVYGMKAKDIDQLTTLAFRPYEYLKNKVTIYAGVKGTTLSTAFAGAIASAQGDYNSAPDIAFKFKAISGFWGQLQAEAPVSVQGDTTVEKLMTMLCKSSGYTLDNQGVTGSVKNTVLNGSPVDKMKRLCEMHGCDLVIDDEKAVMLPRDGYRTGITVYLSDSSGLIGYPTFTDTGIQARCLYNPSLRIFGLVKIQSLVPRASGTWKIVKLSHQLSAYHSSGSKWESTFTAIPLDMSV